MQTQSNKKLNPKISWVYKHCNDLGFLRLFIGLNMAWKLHWLFKRPRKSAVLFYKPLPSNPRGLKHHDHRYRLFFGSDLGSSCQCSCKFISSLSGGTQRKTTALPSYLLAHSQAFGAWWMKPQRGAVYIFLYGTGASNAWGCRDPNRSHLHSLRDLWDKKNVLQMQTVVQEHTSPGDMVSLCAWGRCFWKPSYTHTKENLYQSLFMLGRGFWTSCYHNKPVYRKN